MNISFLNPGLLWFLPISLFPIILHLFFQKKPKRIQFSDLRFIQLALKNVLPRTKLRQIILLIIRSLILLLLLFIAARPIGYSGIFKPGGKTQQVFILFDTSYSMRYNDNGISRINRAKETTKNIVKTILNTKRTDKQIGIFTFSESIEKSIPGLSNDPGYLTKFIDEIEPSYRTTDLVSALTHIYRKFNELPSGERSVIVVTDLCEHIIPIEKQASKLAELIPEFDPGARLIFVNINAGDNDNSYIRQVELSKNISYSDRKEGMLCKAKIENFQKPRSSWLVSLWLNNIPVNDKMANLDRNSSIDIEFQPVLRREMMLASDVYGKVELKEDNLSVDDKYYFIYKPKPELKILIVDGDPKFSGNNVDSESYYLATVPQWNKFTRSMNMKTVDNDEFSREPLSQYDVIFLCNLGGIDAESGDKLYDFMNSKSEKLLVVTLGNKVNPDEYPKWLSENIVKQAAGEFKISSMDTALFNNSGEFELDKIVFNNIFRLVNGTALITLDDNIPLLMEKPVNNNKMLIFASSIDRDWTNFPLKPFYPYFVTTMVDKNIGQEDILKSNITAGNAIVYSGKQNAVNASVKLPDGAVTTAGIVNQNKIVRYDNTNVPGIYELKIETENKVFNVHYAVNVDFTKSESNLKKMANNGLKSFFLPAKTVVFDINKTLENDILVSLEGKELSHLFLIITLLLLTAEIFLSNKP